MSMNKVIHVSLAENLLETQDCPLRHPPGGIPRRHAGSFSYDDFVRDFMAPNLPVIIQVQSHFTVSAQCLRCIEVHVGSLIPFHESPSKSCYTCSSCEPASLAI
jgi:hypothetical protein